MTDQGPTNGWLLEGQVVDGTGAPPIEDGAVAILDDRITWVGPASDIPADLAAAPLQRISEAGRTIIPGLVDAHTHISFCEATSEEENALYTPVEYRSILSAWNAKKMLRAGVTSASDAASTYNIAVAVRDAVEAGIVEGPRFSAAGPQLTTHQGLEDAFPSWVEFPKGQAGVLVRNRDEILEAIRLQVKNGVDVIKVSGSMDSAVSDDPMGGMAFRQEEFDLIADETHRLGKKCTVHARTAASALACARAGFDWLMHASYIDGEGLDAVLEREIPIVPVLTLLVNILEAGEGDVGASALDIFKQEVDAAAENLSRAHQQGATLICGSETGWSLVPFGEWHAKEMQIFVDYLGFTPVAAIHAATGAAAVTLPRWANEIGTLEPGKRADVIVLDGDPVRDIRVVQQRSRFDLVLKDGVAVDLLTPIPERRRYSFEKNKLYLPGRYVFDERAGRGVVVD